MSSGKEPKPALSEAFDRAVDALTQVGASYALIGGFAVAHHGLPRPTQVIDFLVSIPRIELPALLEDFEKRGFTFDAQRVLSELGKDHLSTVCYGGVRVDLLDAVLPLFRQAIHGAIEATIRGRRVRIACPEDLISLKMIACRDDDLRDVRGILATQGSQLDFERIRRSLVECCGKEQVDAFERLVSEAGF